MAAMRRRIVIIATISLLATASIAPAQDSYLAWTTYARYGENCAGRVAFTPVSDTWTVAWTCSLDCPGYTMTFENGRITAIATGQCGGYHSIYGNVPMCLPWWEGDGPSVLDVGDDLIIELSGHNERILEDIRLLRAAACVTP